MNTPQRHLDDVVTKVQLEMMELHVGATDNDIAQWFMAREADCIELSQEGMSDALDEVYESMQVMRFIVEGWKDPLHEPFALYDLEALMQRMWDLRQKTYDAETGGDN